MDTCVVDTGAPARGQVQPARTDRQSGQQEPGEALRLFKGPHADDAALDRADHVGADIHGLVSADGRRNDREPQRLRGQAGHTANLDGGVEPGGDQPGNRSGQSQRLRELLTPGTGDTRQDDGHDDASRN